MCFMRCRPLEGRRDASSLSSDAAAPAAHASATLSERGVSSYASSPGGPAGGGGVS